jgi:hypothetical protein
MAGSTLLGEFSFLLYIHLLPFLIYSPCTSSPQHSLPFTPAFFDCTLTFHILGFIMGLEPSFLWFRDILRTLILRKGKEHQAMGKEGMGLAKQSGK